jgi:hypothetical protein
MDELLQLSPPASGDEQPVSHGGMAAGMDRIEAAKTVPLRLDNANTLPTYPQQTQKQQQEAA